MISTNSQPFISSEDIYCEFFCRYTNDVYAGTIRSKWLVYLQRECVLCHRMIFVYCHSLIGKIYLCQDVQVMHATHRLIEFFLCFWFYQHLGVILFTLCTSHKFIEFALIACGPILTTKIISSQQLDSQKVVVICSSGWQINFRVFRGVEFRLWLILLSRVF